MNETGEQKEHGKWLDDDIHIYKRVCVCVSLCVSADGRSDSEGGEAEGGGAGRGGREQGRSGAECGATGSHCLSVPLGCEFEGGALQDVNSEGEGGRKKMEEEEGLGQGRPVRKGGEWAGGGKLRKRMSKNVLSHARGEKWACLVLLLLLWL